MSSFMQDIRDPEETFGLLELLGEGYVLLSQMLEIFEYFLYRKT